MRVLQLIDSLEAGGAERVAVNFANALVKKIDGSFLCTTRKEGILKESLHVKVGYLFLNKKRTLDYVAFKKLKRYIRRYGITIVHAHSSSFFIASVVKILLKSNIKVIWHLHYGDIMSLSKVKLVMLNVSSRMFDYVFTVNKDLEHWVTTFLHYKKVCYLPNFPVEDNAESSTILKGDDGKRVVCLANLRHPKDHYTLVKAFRLVIDNEKKWSLHLIGKDFNDEYSINLKKLVSKLQLEKHVFFYGSCQDISNILRQSTIGVLSSESEGLPLALLEYGLAGLPVVVTNVGECPEVVGLNQERGTLVSPKDEIAMADAIKALIQYPYIREQKAAKNHNTIKKIYSKKNVLEEVVSKYNSLLF